ncbi:PDDEXK-like family protein [Aureivirga marina]|uniref:PDDEXK-like family protein n=1 Tax=Aureivirga marina TaxID=1182451 RepID=UPI0018CB7136|nr:PD-(D/E)XK nuclease family protein [Aureivirga marina]
MLEHETQLKRLVLDEEFLKLEEIAAEEMDLMSIFRVAHKELPHSNFLSWLFNPNESHKLEDYFIKEFIKLYFKENEYQDLGKTEEKLSVFDFVNMDFSDLEIRREYENIDLFLISEKNSFCIVIENKIHAKEGKGQLEKYYNHVEQNYKSYKHRIYIYLSLFAQEISNENYETLTYKHILKILEKISSNKNIAPNTLFILNQYQKALKSQMNENLEFEQQAKKIYHKYKSAFDFVYKYASPYGSNLVPNKLEDLIKTNESLNDFPSNRSYERFQPKFFEDNYDELLNKGFFKENNEKEEDENKQENVEGKQEKDENKQENVEGKQEKDENKKENIRKLKNNWLFLFEFRVSSDIINFDFKIGDYECKECREKLYNLYLKHEEVFNKIKSKAKLSNKYHLCFQKKIVTKNDYGRFLDGKLESLDRLIEKRFNELMTEDIPKILGVLEEELKK